MPVLRSTSSGYSYFTESSKATDFEGRYEGKSAIVIGNGESRLNYDLWKLFVGTSGDTVTFACNAYYEDAMSGTQPVPQFLGAVDPKINREIYESGYADKYRFLANPLSFEWLYNTLLQELGRTPDPLELRSGLVELNYGCNWNCGVEMAHFALYCGCSQVFLIGFDGPTDDEAKINNVYKVRGESTAVSPEPGRRQMTTLRRKGWPRVPFYQIDTDWIDDAQTIEFNEINGFISVSA